MGKQSAWGWDTVGGGETTTINHWVARYWHQANKYMVGRRLLSVLLSANALRGSGHYPTRVERALGASGAEKCFNDDFTDAFDEWVYPGLKNDLPRVETSDEEREHSQPCRLRERKGSDTTHSVQAHPVLAPPDAQSFIFIGVRDGEAFVHRRDASPPSGTWRHDFDQR